MSDIKFQSIFDDSVEVEKEFDAIFGAEEDCKLMEAVCQFNEEELKADAELLHQVDIPDCTPEDMAKELGPNNDAGDKPTDDTDKYDIKDAELDVNDKDRGVADAVEPDANIDPENIEDMADKSSDKIEKEIEAETKSVDEAYEDALTALLAEAEADLAPEDMPEGEEEAPVESEGCCKKEEAEEAPAVEEEKPAEEGVCPNCGEAECKCEKKEAEEAPATEEDKPAEEKVEDAPTSEETPAEEDKPLIDELEDEEVVEVEDKEEAPAVEEESCKKEEAEEVSTEDEPGEEQLAPTQEAATSEEEDEEDALIADLVEGDKDNIPASTVDELNYDDDDDLIDIVAGK